VAGKTSVMFVCLGNICRSPLAEAIFRKQAIDAGLADRITIASCGTGDWHVGHDADERSRRIANLRGVPMNHTAQTLTLPKHIQTFHYFIAMDRQNVRTLLSRGVPSQKIYLMQAFADMRRPHAVALAADDATSPEVPDPYYEKFAAFEEVFAMLDVSCAGLLRKIQEGL
jgi:protein-tyrosine phosphatase